MIRLLEKNLVIRCLKDDAPLIKDILTDCNTDFNKFLKAELNREFNVNLEVSDKYLEKGESE